ncbi:phage tail tube protein [Brevibacillus laterosporus]|uniref:phage tail tube protein n=1 Tax=Brevibacillus laterosporus TaxID=1465 RepID=UPI00144481A5|nr:phage tail tube protein [Brevibacillus laterosporus]NKQ18427.1 phage tail tube protein [Brevibacillus laterosporus]WNX33194.1 phage tail tube protein [Brevibacillus laterosporus]
MPFLKYEDTINGQEGRAYATINGRVEEMFWLKKFEAKVEKNKKEGKTLNRRGTQHKAMGWKGTGSMTIYYVTTLFRQLMLDYMKTGKDIYFDVQITNEDPTSSVGKQTVVIKGINLDGITMALLDIDSEDMEEEISFTWQDADILDSFVKPTLG